MCLAKLLVDLFPSLRDKQESLEFLPWLVVVHIVILLYVRSWVVDLKHGSRWLLGVTSVEFTKMLIDGAVYGDQDTRTIWSLFVLGRSWLDAWLAWHLWPSKYSRTWVCRYVKGTGNGYVYVLVNFVGYINATDNIYVLKGKTLFVKFWPDDTRNTALTNTFTLLTKHLTVYITGNRNLIYKMYIISSLKVTWTSRIDNGLRCELCKCWKLLDASSRFFYWAL